MKFAAVLLLAVATTACGKKGPPLPPLVLVPSAPGEFAADRRADAVDLRFVVPRANVDGTQPADVVRVDVYALTTVASVPESAAPATEAAGPQVAATGEQVIEQGTLIGSVDVRAPVDEDEEPPAAPVTDVAVSPEGVEQGATAHVAEDLTPDIVGAPAIAPEAGGTPAPSGIPVRTYVAVAVSARGRRSPLSQQASVPLGPAPMPPAQPSVSYDASAATVQWPAPAASPDAGAPGALTYHVYELAAPIEPGAPRVPQRLTESPIPASTFVDKRIEWGAERCYAVSAVHAVGGLTVESEVAEPRCVTFTDTFPPLAPTGVTAVATQGAISLIWQASSEPDLAGYLVLRAAEGAAFAPVTPQPIQETSYRDEVTPGARYRYAVRAVDTAGNASEPSAPIEEMAR